MKRHDKDIWVVLVLDDDDFLLNKKKAHPLLNKTKCCKERGVVWSEWSNQSDPLFLSSWSILTVTVIIIIIINFRSRWRSAIVIAQSYRTEYCRLSPSLALVSHLDWMLSNMVWWVKSHFDLLCGGFNVLIYEKNCWSNHKTFI